jgi:hypothetical protein
VQPRERQATYSFPDVVQTPGPRDAPSNVMALLIIFAIGWLIAAAVKHWGPAELYTYPSHA